MSEQTPPKLLINGRVVVWQFVDHLPEAVRWYSDTFGLASSDNIGHAYFFPINDNTTLALSVSEMNGKTIGAPGSEALDLQCDDIFHTHKALLEKGVRVEPEMRNPAWIYHEFFVWDPEGNRIRLHGFVRDPHVEA
ncbi:VOC family protein [Paenibacillus sp. GYB003]|uniref:VOC family protein n=1 Tax=Paenibacillus sp. GYB003 TaxID=2994392 RepID=UPI002F96C1E7